MDKDSKIRHSINVLAQKYMQQTGNRITHEEAKKRITKAIIKGEK